MQRRDPNAAAIGFRHSFAGTRPLTFDRKQFQTRTESQSMPITIRQVSPAEFGEALPSLIALLQETVAAGTPMGFFAPLSDRLARDYWLSIVPELESGSRVLLVAYSDGRLIGSGQLALAQRQNSSHRAELQKLFVATAVRGQGVGKALVDALHDVALRDKRRLIMLNTRRGIPAEGFYKALGYLEAGVMPGWTIGPAGERYDHVELYRELDRG
jgi:acetyltransferase